LEQKSFTELVKAYKRVFSSEDGRRVLRHLISLYLVRSSHVEGDSHSTAFNEGARNVVLLIMGKLKMNIEEFVDTFTDEDEEEFL
jgi:hypothetical protein